MDRHNLLFYPSTFNPPADPSYIDQLPSLLGVSLPDDYLNYLRHSNGGFAGDVKIWPAEELEEGNRLYRVEEGAPGLFLFGSLDGDPYGFDLRRGAEIAVVVAADVVPEWETCSFEAASFSEFWWNRSKDAPRPSGQILHGWVKAEFLSGKPPAPPKQDEDLPARGWKSALRTVLLRHFPSLWAFFSQFRSGR